MLTISKENFDLRVKRYYHQRREDFPRLDMKLSYASHMKVIEDLIDNTIRTQSSVNRFSFPLQPSYICVYNVLDRERLSKIVKYLKTIRLQLYGLILVDTDVGYILSNMDDRQWPIQELHCSNNMTSQSKVGLAEYPRRFNMPSLKIVNLGHPDLLSLWNSLDMDLSSVEILRMKMIGFTEDAQTELIIHPSIKNLRVLDLHEFTIIDKLVFEELPSSLEWLRYMPTRGYHAEFFESLMSGRLTDLNTLVLSGCDRWIDLSKLPSLLELRLTLLADVVEPLNIQNCSDLIYLDIHHTSPENIDYGSSYVGLKSLRRLNIVGSHGNISYDDRFDQLSQLRHLSIDCNMAFKRSIYQIPHLETLTLNQISPASLRSIRLRRFSCRPRIFLRLPLRLTESDIFRMLDSELGTIDGMVKRRLVGQLKIIREKAYTRTSMT